MNVITVQQLQDKTDHPSSLRNMKVVLHPGLLTLNKSRLKITQSELRENEGM